MLSSIRAFFGIYCCVVVVAFVLVQQTSARTIRWTAAAGNPLWDSANNWDSLTVPTSSDDVIIDVANIPGNVHIGSPAQCNSLIIGGDSGTAQTLTLYTSLDIGKGGGEIMANGNLILNVAPTTPLTTAGLFKANSKFTFISGALGGVGVFNFINVPFNGTALKVINATTVVTGSLILDPGTGPAVIQIASSVLNVTGTVVSSATVEFMSNPGATLLVPGTVLYTGGQTNSFSVQGDAIIAQLTASSGVVTLEDNVTVLSTSVASGASIQVIGSLAVTRKFGTVSGSGSFLIQGGNNIFSSIYQLGDVQLSGGNFVVTGPSSLISLESTGGQISGGATITISSATFSNAAVFSTPLVVTAMKLNGFAQIDGSPLTITQAAVIASDSQFTLNNGASFVVGSKAAVTQSYPLQILPGGPSKLPFFNHNGKWTSSSDLKVLVNTTGSGLFQFGQGSTTEITGVPFTTGSFTLSNAVLTVIGSTLTVGSVSGTGLIQAQGQSFTVLNSLQISNYTHTNGQTSVGTATIVQLDVADGGFTIGGSTSSFTTLNFTGGTITGTSTAISVGNLNASGSQPKTFTSTVVTVKVLNLDCSYPQCQLFTSNAKILTSC